MKKSIILLAAGLIAGFAVNAQQITNQSNTVDKSYSLFQTNSPTNTYGNRWDIIWLNKDEIHIRTPKQYFDSTIGKQAQLTANPKFAWIDETTGQFKITTKDSITWPWSKITSKPYIFSGIDTISLSNRIDTKFTIPSGTTSQYVRGDGTLATLPVYSAGTGLSLASGVFTNVMPDQTIVFSTETGISINSSYPNFTVTNTAPMITQTVTGQNGITVLSGTNTFTVSKTKRQETYSGTTDGSGLYSVTYSVSYSSAPNIQMSFIGTNPRDVIMLTSSTTTGFTVQVQRRVDVVGLLPSYSNQSGVTCKVLVTEE